MFILDSNVFIEAKDRYYAFDICPGFWSWMDHMFLAGDVVSIMQVREELLEGHDALAEWIKHRPYKNVFLEVSDLATQRAYREVAQFVQNGSCSPSAKAHFLSKADPWLIAKAHVTQSTLVTHESLNLEAKNRVLIPNVCKHFNAGFLNTFDVLRNLSASFVLPSDYS